MMKNSSTGKHNLKLTIFSGKSLPEWMVYNFMWAIMLLLPVVIQFLNTVSGVSDKIEWGDIFNQWLGSLPYIILFIFHNQILLPYLFTRSRIHWYIISALLVSALMLFTVNVITVKYRNIKPLQHVERPEMMPGNNDGVNMPPLRPDGPPANFDMRQGPPADFDMMQAPPPTEFGKREPGVWNPMFFPGNDPFGLNGPFFGRMIVVMLMFTFNIAVKLFYRSLRDQESIKEMERLNLKTELDYLKTQLNPHFFMNTLNNIHALVDIDTEKAKDTIIELSQLMRYVLYEANRPSIQLSKEIDFLNHYIQLMRIRYTDKLQINTSFPDGAVNIQVPPLLFISFIENAFKHGVSYREASFINISMQLHDGEVTFLCSNSAHKETTQDKNHGVGFENIRKRLDLLFGENYDLCAVNGPDRYDVSLTFPVNSY